MNEDQKKDQVKCRIDDISWQTDAQIVDSCMGFPNVTLRHLEFSREPERQLIDDGWVYEGYDRYMDYSNYHKTVSIRSLRGAIVVEFTKLTDYRDKMKFGFTEAFMRGAYRYPVPADLKDQILRSVHSSGYLSEQLAGELKHRVEWRLIEDEFRALARLKEDHLRALLRAIDKQLSPEEQKTAFAEASREVENRNPAYCNIWGSRSHVVIHKNFDLAYAEAGIE